jgi:RNA polymerase sigma factor (sigma-70 family)
MKDRHRRVLELLEAEGPRLHALLARLTRREDAVGDLLQELVTRLCQSGGFARARNPSAYAWRAAANLAFEWRRRQRANVRPLDEAQMEDAAALQATGPSPLGTALEEEELRQVLDATAKLGDLARQAVILRYIEQESYEEIGRRLGKKPQHIRSITSKALAQLRRLLENKNNGEFDGA